MQLTKSLKNKALDSLRYEGILTLPREIAKTGFFIGRHDDTSIIAHGAVEFEGVEYKIGTKK